MAKRRKRRKSRKRRRRRYGRMVEPIIDVSSISITSGLISASPATGATRTVLYGVPTVMAAGTLKKYSKKWW